MNKKIPAALCIAIILIFSLLICLTFCYINQMMTPDITLPTINFNAFNSPNTASQNEENDKSKNNLIRLETPLPNQTVSSPLTIRGQARGSWFFEASFPVFLIDWDGRIIAQGIASAESDWMTSEFVPFEATLTFTADKETYSHRGALILKKDNPSGLPKNDDALEIPIIIS